MGKGDIKSKKGKRSAGSYGKTRKRKTVKAVIDVKPKKEAKKTAPKKETTETKTAAKKAPAKNSSKKDYCCKNYR